VSRQRSVAATARSNPISDSSLASGAACPRRARTGLPATSRSPGRAACRRRHRCRAAHPWGIRTRRADGRHSQRVVDRAHDGSRSIKCSRRWSRGEGSTSDIRIGHSSCASCAFACRAYAGRKPERSRSGEPEEEIEPRNIDRSSATGRGRVIRHREVGRFGSASSPEGPGSSSVRR